MSCIVQDTSFLFWGGLAYKHTRLVRYDIAAGIVPVSPLKESDLFFCYISLKMLKIPDMVCMVKSIYA